MNAVMQAVERTLGEAGARAGIHLWGDFSARSPQRQEWVDLCRWGGAVIGVLCLTSSVAAVILAWLERV
ncbi:hypothetical protein [Ramlibacter sp. AN1133]|uniref:hypothetical protein n=1 Tax=Ramlibacter sp. AN1133 TaxID=3133429 RepID=UPI0030C1DE51